MVEDWSNLEIATLYVARKTIERELKTQGKELKRWPLKPVIEIFNNHFPGNNRTESAIRNKIGNIFKLPKSKVSKILKSCGVPTDKIKEESFNLEDLKVQETRKTEGPIVETVSTPRYEPLLVYPNLVDALRDYDKKNVLDCLRKRENVLYGLMLYRANLIKEFDASYESYKEYQENRDKLEKSGFDSETLEKLLKAIEIKESPKLDRIELVAIPGFGKKRNQFSLLLPLYLEDSKSKDNGFRELLYCSTLSILANDFGLRKPSDVDLVVPFGDLLKFNFEGEAQDYQEMEGRITNEIRDEYDSIQVSIVEDLPFYIPI